MMMVVALRPACYSKCTTAKAVQVASNGDASPMSGALGSSDRLGLTEEATCCMKSNRGRLISDAVGPSEPHAQQRQPWRPRRTPKAVSLGHRDAGRPK